LDFFFFLDRRVDRGFLGILSGFFFFISLEGVFLFFCALSDGAEARSWKEKAFVHMFVLRILTGGVFILFLTFDFIAMYVIKTI